MSIERLDLSQLDEVYREQRLRTRHCTGPCRQGRATCPTPIACSLADPDEPRNDASLWREWCDFIESAALPPGVRLGSMLRGLFWIAIAACFVGAGIALAVSALPSIGT